MRLTGIAWRGYSLPFRQKYVTSDSQSINRCGLLLFLINSDRLVGVGEASPVGAGSPKEVDGIVATLEGLTSRLLSSESDALEETMSTWEMPPSLRFGIETALLDLRGQAERLPLTALLGGKPLPLSANGIITAESPEQAATEAREVVGLGFSNLKLKIGRGTLAKDEKLVSAVREAVGLEVKLRLDPNQAWSVNQAIESIRRLSRYQIEFVEQPVASSDVAGLAEVRRSVPVPLAADESLNSLVDLHRLLDTSAADIFIIKAARLGGLSESLKVATEALEASHSVVVTTSLESSVGIAASAHLAAALPVQSHPHGLATGLLFDHDLTYSRFLPRKGILMAPVGPGLGVKVDAKSLRKHSSAVIGSIGSISGLQEYLSL